MAKRTHLMMLATVIMLLLTAAGNTTEPATSPACVKLEAHSTQSPVTESIDRVTLWYYNLGPGYGVVGDFMANHENYTKMRQLLIETGLIETRLGTDHKSYASYAKGWSQFIPPGANQQVAFNEVKAQLSKPENSARATTIFQRWGLDVSTITADELDCNDDWGTIFALEYYVFGIKIDKSISSEYKKIDTPEERATFWKRFYNRAGENGLPETTYVGRSTEPDKNGIIWVYSGNYESYDLSYDPSTGEVARVASFEDNSIEFIIQPCFSNGVDFAQLFNSLEANDCVDITYCDEYYSKSDAEDAEISLESHPLWKSGMNGIYLGAPRLSSSPTPTVYANKDKESIPASACKSVKRASFWYPGCQMAFTCPYSSGGSSQCAYLGDDLSLETGASCPLPLAPTADTGAKSEVAAPGDTPEIPRVRHDMSDIPTSGNTNNGGSQNNNACTPTPDSSATTNENAAGQTSQNSNSSSSTDYLGLGILGVSSLILLSIFGYRAFR